MSQFPPADGEPPRKPTLSELLAIHAPPPKPSDAAPRLEENAAPEPTASAAMPAKAALKSKPTLTELLKEFVPRLEIPDTPPLEIPDLPRPDVEPPAPPAVELEAGEPVARPRAPLKTTSDRFGRGRPSAMSVECVQSICEALRVGATRKAAAENNGVSDRTLRRWMERGEEDEKSGEETPFSAFSASIREAEVETRWKVGE